MIHLYLLQGDIGIDLMRWCSLGMVNHAGHGVSGSWLWLLSQCNYVGQGVLFPV